MTNRTATTAAIILSLSVIGVGGAFAVSQRRSRRTTALPS